MDALVPAQDRSPSVITVALIAVLATTLVLWQAGRQFFSYQDDAFIYFRYVDNFQRGLGLVYNAGERVQGYTSPLWLALLILAALAHLPPIYAAGIFGTLCAVALVLLVLREGLRDGLRGPYLALAPLALATSFHLIAWAVAGLETLLCALLVFAALSAYRRGAGLGTGLLIAAAGLARPEGAMLVLVLGLDASLRARRPCLRLCAPALLLGGALLLANRWYFGDALPNTFYAKLGGDVAHARLGLAYVGRFLLAAPLGWAALLLALPGPGTPRPAALRAWLAVIALWLLNVIQAGGDHFAYHRFLVPLLPSLYSLGAAGLQRACTDHVPRRWLGRLLALAVLVAVIAAQRQPVQYHVQHGFERVLGAAKLGRLLGQRLPPGTTIALTNIGAVGYYSRLPIIDLLGLVDRELARRPTSPPGLAPRAQTIGHEKFDIAFSLRRRPELVVFDTGGSARPMTDLAEMPCPYPALEELQGYLRAHGGYRVRDVPVDEHAYWTVLVREDVAWPWP